MNQESLEHWYKNIFEKLTALENSGNGAIIHDVRSHLGLINIYQNLAEKEKKYITTP